MELIGCLDDDEGRAGAQVVGLEQAVDGRFRDEVALHVGERYCQFPWRQLRLIQGQLYDLAAEPSTWAGLAGLAVIFGISADEWQVMSNALAAVAAAVSMFVREK